jgi:hypothetical protein
VRLFGKRKKKAAGFAFITAIGERIDELYVQSREPKQIQVTRLAMRGVVSHDEGRTCDLYVHPDDWANVDLVAEEFPEPVRRPVTMLWGLPVTYS